MKKIIGSICVPLREIAIYLTEWRKAFGYPEMTRADWKTFNELQGSIIGSLSIASHRDIIVDTSRSLKLAKGMSFYEYIKNRIVSEASTYASFGIKEILLSFSIGEAPAFYWLMRNLCEDFKNACNGEIRFGMSSGNPLWSAEIASRFECDYCICHGAGKYYDACMERNKMCDGKSKKVAPSVYLRGSVDSFEGIEGYVVEDPTSNAIYLHAGRIKEKFGFFVPILVADNGSFSLKSVPEDFGIIIGDEVFNNIGLIDKKMLEEKMNEIG